MAREVRTPTNKEANFQEMERLRGKYEYPNNLNLHPDSESHQKLLELIMNSAAASYAVVSLRFDTWKELDEKLTVYIDLDDEEKSIQDDDKSKPVSIVVPISYATRETLLTYWSAAFLNHPIFRYVPSKDPKDLIGVMMLESLIAQDCIAAKVALDLHTMWGDQFTYGWSAGSPTWITKYGYKSAYKTETERVFGFPVKRRERRVREQVTKFEGNALKALDPYNCLPDPNVPITDVENMDFFGWVERTSYNKLLTDENLGTELFNVKYLNALNDKRSVYFSADSTNTGRYSKTSLDYGQPNTATASKPTDVMPMYIWLVPKDYGLSDSEYPEHWAFKVAADRVIIQARPSDFDHNTHPVATMACDSDGHTSLPVSILEREFPIQHGIDWLWKSHVANVRKAVNNMFLIDPSLVNTNDVVDSRFGMLARLRPAAWGKGIKDALEQIPIQDVTKNHIQDIGFLMGVDSRVFTSDQSKGHIERKGERVSASEARDTRVSFLSKMEKMARIGAMQGHFDIAYQFASNTIQLVSDTKIVKVLGDYKEVLMREYQLDFDYAEVDPKSLAVNFDVVPQDGSIPGGEYADVWERLLAIASKHPDVYRTLDLTRVWLHVARLLGAKNAEEFKKKPMTSRVEDSTTIERGAKAGRYATADQLATAANLEEV